MWDAEASQNPTFSAFVGTVSTPGSCPSTISRRSLEHTTTRTKIMYRKNVDDYFAFVVFFTGKH
jgi:hypothetical protein